MANEAEPIEEHKDPVPDERAGSGERERVPRGISEKRIKVIAVVAVVAVIVIVLLWGMVPEKIYEIRDLADEIDDLRGIRVNVKGIVINWDSAGTNFTLADSKDENLTILVKHTGPFPEGFGINATAVVKGVVVSEGGQYKMDSDEIQIGCPSKY